MAITAIPVGFVAGLFGIGGGLITVPFLYFVFGLMAVSGRGLVKAAENNYEKLDIINELNESNEM